MKKTLLIGLPLALRSVVHQVPTGHPIAAEATIDRSPARLLCLFPSAIMALLFPYISFIASLVFIDAKFRSATPRKADALALASRNDTDLLQHRPGNRACYRPLPCGASVGRR